MGRYQEAEEDYTAALATMPNEAALFAGRGYARQQLGRTTAAATDFNTAIRLDDTRADVFLDRGNLYASEGLYEQAAADLQRALALDADLTGAYRSVAWLLSTCPLEEYRSAERGLEAAHRFAQLLGDEDPVVLDTLAAAYANSGDFRQAITYQQQAIVLAGQEVRSAYNQRLELYRAGKPYRTP